MPMSLKKSSILLFILIFTGMTFIGIACSGNQNGSNEDLEEADHHQAEESAIPLIYQMSFISRYAKKLYFAGEAENWELANIYNHEIEEISDGIVAGEVVDDGINISQLMESMFLPQVESIGEAIDSGDREMFLNRYNIMIQTCNQCHAASDYGAVKVTVPENNPFNQDFSAD